MGVLNIPEIPQYGVLIEEKYEKEQSLFYDVYKGAANNIYDIIKSKESFRIELFSNPCIAFVGKRGTGKSSAMSSFANFLDISNKDNCVWIKDDLVRKSIEEADFFVLPAIDTANMGNNETIIADVSAEMFSSFRKNENIISVDEKRMFIKSIKKINETAISKSSGEWIKQGDNLLNITDNVVHMKNLFEDTVNCFLRTMPKTKNSKNSFLVIQIDDLDMNISNSYNIMEEIRNLLSIKNVIVLLSVDIEQLKTVLNIHFASSLKITEKNHQKKISQDLSHKYIEKLLPSQRRHYMPELTSEQLKLHRSRNFLGDNDENWERMGLIDKQSKYTTPSVLDAVMHLIWRKTMLIPMRNEFGDYILLPHNLRSLCNLIVFLRNMKDVAFPCNIFDNNLEPNKKEITPLTFFDFSEGTLGEERRNTLEHNLRLFHKYIVSNLETFCQPEMNNFDERLSQVLINLIETMPEVDISEINSKIVEEILVLINEKTNEKKNNDKCDYEETMGTINIEKILKATKYSDNISSGDVMYVLGKIDRKTHCKYIRYLIEVLRTLWSIKMTNELYIVGCDPQNTNYCSAKFISENFHKTVGAMWLNPDSTQTFFCDEKQSDSDWYVDESKNTPNIYDIVIPKNTEFVKKKDDKTFYEVKCWRIHLKSGESNYGNVADGDENYYPSHPMVLFSNLLKPKSINAAKRMQAEKFQSAFVTSLPFYSMDYMYRLYEEFRKNVKKTACSQKSSIISNIITNLIAASDKLLKETKNYIPFISPIKVNNFNADDSDLYKKTQEEHFLFKAPLVALESIIDWDLELVILNVKLLEKFRRVLSEIDSTAIEDSKKPELLKELINFLKAEFPDKIIEKDNDKWDHPLADTESVIKELNEYLDNLENNKTCISQNLFMPYRIKSNQKPLAK